MRKLLHARSAFMQSIAAVVAIACILMPAYAIYKNLKKDFGIDGQGGIVVAEDCRHVGPWDNDFECKGTYRQGSGDVSVPDAVVHVTGRHLKGEYVGDIYRYQSVGYDAPVSKQRYISGDDRRSLLHNLPLLGAMLGGFVMLGWSLWPRGKSLFAARD